MTAMQDIRRGKGRALLLLTLVFVLFVVLYAYNLGGWLMHDDEGAAFYEAWQLQEGRQPGVDFIAENQPLFLVAGRSVIDSVGRSPTALRLLSAVPTLLGAGFLALALYRVWRAEIAILTLGLTLSTGILYEQARIFRPDAMMLGWEMLGLGTVLLALHSRRRYWWAIAGCFYGGAVLWKLFGLLPVLGLVLFFADRLRRERHDLPLVLRDGLAFALPFLLVAGGLSWLLYRQLGFYYAEAFSYHATMEQTIGLLARVGRNALAFLLTFLASPVFLFLWPLWFLNRKTQWKRPAMVRLLLWQVAAAAVLLFATRPVHVRYFLFLVPVFALLLAWQISVSIEQAGQNHSAVERYFPLIAIFFITFAIFTTRPSIPQMSTRRDTDTWQLARYVAQNTAPEDRVLADYATINFLADRASIYEAPIIAGAQIETGVVTAKMLQERIEQHDVQMVLLHVKGGDPFPHHFVRLAGYEEFRRYLLGNFELQRQFDRNGQKIEIFVREPKSRDF